MVEQEYSYIRVHLLTNLVAGKNDNKSLRIVLNWLRNNLSFYLGIETARMVGRTRKPMSSFFPWEEIGAGNADSIYFCDKGEHLTNGEQERITVVAKGAGSGYILWYME